MAEDGFAYTTLGRQPAIAQPRAIRAQLTAFFPVDSALPAPYILPATKEHRSLEAVTQEAGQLTTVMERHLVSGPELHVLLRSLADALALARAHLDPELRTLAAHHDHATSAKVSDAVIAAEADSADDVAALQRDYRIYDLYFDVIRVPAMTVSQFAAQATRSCQRIIDDLPYAVLGIDEIHAILQAMTRLFSPFVRPVPGKASVPPPADPMTVSAEHADNEEPYALVWAASAAGDPDAHTRRVAFYRWLAGHHFFDLCAMACRAALLDAKTALANDDAAAVGVALDRAATFLRGTTAAMWYAANFPRIIYQHPVRPSMESTEAPDGFSGTMNPDYARMKTAKALLKQTLTRRYGRDLQRWPVELASAFIRFHETDIADTEHHVLIALSKTGFDSSLAQKKWQANLPAGASRHNALALLRALTDERRQEFEY